ncbi:hypothetical protein CMI47_14115 [Candidatus Pacearchaeota archaeon]|jgi:hypothetical protein|nr:hypothetical protein [Candidatus Pacearchaeota archaeon]|tara:strand:- start:6018 stop:6590 length:573 start_codon:yes stop_codon:yes gene_type:complete
MEENKKDNNESYNNSSKDEQYSHQALIMFCMKQCAIAGKREMRAGYFNTRIDSSGNVIKTYIEDTRKAFIESVKNVKMFMDCDFDDKARENIKKIKDNLYKVFKEFCQKEFEEWDNLPVKIRDERWGRGVYYHRGSLNTNLYFYQEFIEQQVEHYRQIFTELNQLASRRKFYTKEIYGEDRDEVIKGDED